QNLSFATEASNASGCCFPTASCTGAVSLRPALPAPQAFTRSEALPASVARLSAAFRSRSSTTTQSGCCGLRQRNTRSDNVSCASTQPEPEHIVLDGYHRSATTIWLPYQPAW